jgi:DNA topoisomerase-3
MSTVVLAEKPSVARDIARVLGARGGGQGCLRGNGYCVTWALGHLVQFAEPDDYGAEWAARWSLAQLPMIPERWRLRLIKSAAQQFRIVKGLLNAADTERVICATDAGREGELIFRLIVEHARCRKPVQRLWVSSLTDEAIREGFARLRPGSDYDPLAAAARARARADWLVGMNLTRAYTVHNGVLCTIGRVQTPTLAMIVARDAAIADFTKAYFYELVAHLAEGFDAKYEQDGESRIDKKEQAERLHRELSPHRTGTVVSIDKKIRRNRPPPLYDLTTLQRDANRRFGFTAAKTLELAQSLYETHKLISYPRTESRHIGEDMLPQLPGILRGVDHPLAAEALARLEGGHRLGKGYVDKTKLTDHHAILPTAKRPPENLPEPLRRLYDLVAARFVGVFLPDQQVEETRVVLDIGCARFVAKGSVELEAGWKRVEPRRRPRPGAAAHGTGGEAPTESSGPPSEQSGLRPGPVHGDEHRALPPLQTGQTVHVDSLELQEKETQPPRPYDDATLLNAMKHAGREIEDDALAAAMRESGLGTPATRAETIEKLIRTGYVERRRKQLCATDKGRALIAMVAEPLRSAELTAAWEQRLKDVEQGAADADAFYRDICALVGELIPRVAAGPAMSAEQRAAARAAAPGASRKRRGGRSGAAGEARGKPRAPSARASDLGHCPVCTQGEVIENSKAFGCSRWRDGCKLTIWKTVAGHKLSMPEVRRLLAEGRTGPIDGLRSKAGKPFRAELCLDDAGKVGFASRGGALEDAAGSLGMPAAHGAGVVAGEAPMPVPARESDGAAASCSGYESAPAAAAGAAAVSRSVSVPPAAASSAPAPDAVPSQTPATAGSGFGTCPKCGRGQVIRGRRGFGCNRWRDGCDFVIWSDIAGHRLTEAELRRLLDGGTIGPVPDLIDSDGRTYAACLRLDDNARLRIEPLSD